jgi:hypothetical protein
MPQPRASSDLSRVSPPFSRALLPAHHASMPDSKSRSPEDALGCSRDGSRSGSPQRRVHKVYSSHMPQDVELTCLSLSVGSFPQGSSCAADAGFLEKPSSPINHLAMHGRSSNAESFLGAGPYDMEGGGPQFEMLPPAASPPAGPRPAHGGPCGNGLSGGQGRGSAPAGSKGRHTSMSGHRPISHHGLLGGMARAPAQPGCADLADRTPRASGPMTIALARPQHNGSRAFDC